MTQTQEIVKGVTEEDNARQATLKILKILDKYNLSKRQVRIIFDIIMNDYKYTKHNRIVPGKQYLGDQND